MQSDQPPDTEKLEHAKADAIVEHFKKIPDAIEYALDCSGYPLAKLEKLKKVVTEALASSPPQSATYLAYHKTLKSLSGLITTRVDYVRGFVEQVLAKKSIVGNRYPLETATTSDILLHVDLMKDVGVPPDLHGTDYNEALQKLVKVLKFRFNEALDVYKELYSVTYEEIAKNLQKFPQEDLEQYKNFLEDALLMTKRHITVKTQQIRQLKSTLLKILESLAIRALELSDSSGKAHYNQILNLIEANLDGFEVEFTQEIIERFSNTLPEIIAEQYPLAIIKHSRKLVELIIETSESSDQILDLYDMLVDFTVAESEKVRWYQSQELGTPAQFLEVKIIKGEEEFQEEMRRFQALTLTQRALALIRLSLYGLFEYISSALSIEELNKYPFGIIKSIEKTLKDLEQHGLSEKDARSIRNNPDYLKALELVDKTLTTYKISGEKHDFIKIYKEIDYEVSGVIYCAFEDPILRMIQNIGEASFIMDSAEGGIPEDRQQELEVTIMERYRQEWERQAEDRQKEEEFALAKLAESL